MLFNYTGIDSIGKNVSSKIEANTLEEAKLKLKYKKIIYTEIDEDKVGLFKKLYTSKKRMNNLTLSYMSRDLSLYLKAGINLVKAVKLLKQRYEYDKTLSSFFDSIEAFLDEGKSFYNALEKQNIFKIPDFYIQSIRVSEDGGILESVLLELSQFLKEQDKIKKDLTSAMAYPLFILSISVLMVVFMLSIVVPKIADVFIQLDKELPLITQYVINTGDFLTNNHLTITISLVFFLLFFKIALKKSNSFKYFINKILLKIPFFGNMIELNELSRFSYMSSILIKSGLPVVHAIKLSSDILKNTVIKNVFQKASDKIVEGERLSVILDRSSSFVVDRAFIHAVAIGEETGELSSILNNLAKLYTETSRDKNAIFLSLLEPLLMLVIGLIIGFIILAMLMPIFTLSIG